MIKVVVISNSQAHSELLSKSSDMIVHVVNVSLLQLMIDAVASYSPDIIVINDAPKDMSVDMLSYEFSLNVPNARNIILVQNQPTFEMLQNSGFKVRGYLTFEQWNDLPKAIRVVHDGEAWLPRRLVAEMLNRFVLDLGH